MKAYQAYKLKKINFHSLVKYKNEDGVWVYGKIISGYQFPDFQSFYNVDGKDVDSDDLVFPEYDDEFYILSSDELVPLKTYEFQTSYSNDWVTKVFIGCTPWPHGTAKYVAVDDSGGHVRNPEYYSYARLPLELRIKNKIAKIAPGKEDEIAEIVAQLKDQPPR